MARRCTQHALRRVMVEPPPRAGPYPPHGPARFSFTRLPRGCWGKNAGQPRWAQMFVPGVDTAKESISFSSASESGAPASAATFCSS